MVVLIKDKFAIKLKGNDHDFVNSVSKEMQALTQVE